MMLNVTLPRDVQKLAPVRKFMDFNLSCGSRCEVDFTRHSGDPSVGHAESIEFHTVLIDGDECTESVDVNRYGIRGLLVSTIERIETEEAYNQVDELMAKWGDV